MSRISSDKFTYSNDDTEYLKYSSNRASSRGHEANNMRGRESANSLDDSSVRNSQSGTTDGGGGGSINYVKPSSHVTVTAAALTAAAAHSTYGNGVNSTVANHRGHHHNSHNYHQSHQNHHGHAANVSNLHSTPMTGGGGGAVSGSVNAIVSPATAVNSTSLNAAVSQGAQAAQLPNSLMSSSNANSNIAFSATATTTTGVTSANNGSIYGHSRLNSAASSMMGSTDTINKRETLHSRFDFVKVLGKGTYGKVKLANDKRTGKQVDFAFILSSKGQDTHTFPLFKFTYLIFLYICFSSYII